MTTPDAAPPQYTVLYGADPGDAAGPCWKCARPLFVFGPFLVVRGASERFDLICSDCARRAVPALALCVEALNQIAANLGAVDADNAVRIAGSMILMVTPVTVPFKLLVSPIERNES